MVRALIFDFDGLMVETESSAFASLAAVYRAHGAEFTMEVFGKGVGGLSSGFDYYDHLEALVGRPIDKATALASFQHHHHEGVLGLPVQPGVLDYLADAERLGLKLGVASSSSRAWVHGHLARLGLIDRFHAVKTRDDAGGVRKPSPDVFLAALDALGLPAREAIAFEDSPNGISAAQAAGIYCVAVPNPVTRSLDLTHADLSLESLADATLAEVLALRAGG